MAMKLVQKDAAQGSLCGKLKWVGRDDTYLAHLLSLV
jgi:hypothetical protein